MSGWESAAQRLVFGALDGVISCPVYDDAPFLPEGMPRDGFPYAVIGNDTATAWDTDTALGANCTVTVHVWSRAEGFAECKAILGEIYTALNRATLATSGFRVVDCTWAFSDTLMDPDGETRHGITRYRLVIEQA